jgi:hypothetical protein
VQTAILGQPREAAGEPVDIGIGGDGQRSAEGARRRKRVFEAAEPILAVKGVLPRAQQATDLVLDYLSAEWRARACREPWPRA